MSSVLRHNAARFGLRMRPDGYARVDDMLALPKFRGHNLAAVRAVVDADEKNRYNLKQETDSSGLTAWWVRANQGHSMQTVTIEMRELVDPTSIPMAVHGTKLLAWNSIVRQGLSRMTRQHIHFAQGLASDQGVVSGMRKTSEVLVFIDVAKAMESGIKFFISENGVVLTPGNAQGFLPPQFFSRVENAETGSPIDGISGPRQPMPLATAEPASLESAGKVIEGTEKIDDDDEEDAEAAWAAIAAKTASIELQDSVAA
ncbi:KptA family-domain-containing protein [Auriculariales sp. MPI-PUGE-AT-0066]|nr:KptA family-domain-containing protein [Auriculariales sp. MPI-PUGE-AT-0066]